MEWLRLENHWRSSNATLHSSSVTSRGHYSESSPETTPDQLQMRMENINAPSVFTGEVLNPWIAPSSKEFALQSKCLHLSDLKYEQL